MENEEIKKKNGCYYTNYTVQSTVNGKWQYKFQDSHPSIFINLMVDYVLHNLIYMYQYMVRVFQNPFDIWCTMVSNLLKLLHSGKSWVHLWTILKRGWIFFHQNLYCIHIKLPVYVNLRFNDELENTNKPLFCFNHPILIVIFGEIP